MVAKKPSNMDKNKETLDNPAHPRDSSVVITGMDCEMGDKQLGFGDYEQTTAKKRTRRERFLAEMEAAVP
jgi:hypothetical protein